MVLLEWPPTTGTTTSVGRRPVASATNSEALTTSSVVIPNNRFGLKTLADFIVSATIGTSELTGFEMTRRNASGQVTAISLLRL